MKDNALSTTVQEAQLFSIATKVMVY